jgi:hypothetical protein
MTAFSPEDSMSPQFNAPTAKVTLGGDEELTEFLGEMMALGLVRAPDGDTSAEKAATSSGSAEFELARSIWELENGGLYRPFYLSSSGYIEEAEDEGGKSEVPGEKREDSAQACAKM